MTQQSWTAARTDVQLHTLLQSTTARDQISNNMIWGNINNTYRVVQLNFSLEISVLFMLRYRCHCKIGRDLSNIIHNTSIACVKSSWTTLYSCQTVSCLPNSNSSPLNRWTWNCSEHFWVYEQPRCVVRKATLFAPSNPLSLSPRATRTFPTASFYPSQLLSQPNQQQQSHHQKNTPEAIISKLSISNHESENFNSGESNDFSLVIGYCDYHPVTLFFQSQSQKCHLITVGLSPCDKVSVTIFCPGPEVVTISDNQCTYSLLSTLNYLLFYL